MTFNSRVYIWARFYMHQTSSNGYSMKVISVLTLPSISTAIIVNLLLKIQCQEYFTVCAKGMGPNEKSAEETTGLYQKRAYTSLGTSCPQCVHQILLLSACIFA